MNPAQLSNSTIVAPNSAGGPLARVRAVLQGWICERIELQGEEGLLARFHRPKSLDWIEILVSPQSEAASFKRFEHCQIRYRGSLRDPDPRLRRALGVLIDDLGGWLDGALGRRPGAGIAEALGRVRAPRQLTFGRDTLLALLHPHLAIGATVCDGWVLEDVYPSTQIKVLVAEQPLLVLDFRQEATGRRALFSVGRRVQGVPAHGTSASLAVTLLSGMGDPAGTELLQAIVTLAVQIHDHDAIAWSFPERLEVVVAPPRALLTPADIEAEAALLAAAESQPPPPTQTDDAVLNLSITSECAQTCQFCSVKELFAASDGGDATFDRLALDLLANRRRGVRRVRLNGYDPLGYSRILDVARLVRRLGYEHTTVFSPCTRLADVAFCSALLEALPSAAEVIVPLYGADAATHDRAVGRAGAFDLVTRAIDNLAAAPTAPTVRLATVLMRETLGGLGALRGFAHDRGLDLRAHMPHPSFESRADRYYHATPRQTEAARAVAETFRSEGHESRLTRIGGLLGGVAPCIVFRQMAAVGVPLRSWLDVSNRPSPLPGTEYRDPQYQHPEGDQVFEVATVPCPHATACVLASACPAEILRAYVDLYGSDEFRPVRLGDLVEAP